MANKTSYNTIAVIQKCHPGKQQMETKYLSQDK